VIGYVIQVIDSLDVTLVDKSLEKLRIQIAGFFPGYAYDLFISGRYETVVSDSNHRLVTSVHIGRSICANCTRKFHCGMAKSPYTFAHAEISFLPRIFSCICTQQSLGTTS
jgi:hypothetical protein